MALKRTNEVTTPPRCAWFGRWQTKVMPRRRRWLAACTRQGQGVAQNYGEVFKWYRLAANQGNADAQFSLGEMYAEGRGVPQDQAEAAKWYRKAADQGDAKAQYSLGIHYFVSAPPNYAEALKWYRKAANQGNADAQFSVGWMYEDHLGVSQNFAEALKWYRKAANQGNADAQYSVGRMYEQGEGAPQNYAEAAKWYRKAAEQGETVAQKNLGSLYEQGQGVPQNYIWAHMWFNLAIYSNQASPSVIWVVRELEDWLAGEMTAARDRVASKMTAAQLTQAQVMAEQCLRSNYKDCGWPHVARREDEVTSPPTARNKVSLTGTAFFVSQTGHIVTNAHVADGCQTVRASRGGTLRKISTDKASDLALYVASERPNSFARLRGGRGAKAGEPVVAVGFPLSGVLSSDPIVTTGTISALSGLGDDRRQIQISAPVQPGNSGSPLLGENCSVVGVVVGKIDAVKVAKAIGDIPQNVNFAVSLGTLQSFLNANGVDYALDDSKRTKSPADIAAEASRYTLLLECLR